MKNRLLVALAFVAALAMPIALSAQVCGETTWDLTAGQQYDVGSIVVSNDLDNVYVTYALDDPDYPAATFGELHVWIGNSVLNVPANPQGIPVPGQFCSADGGACADASGLQSYTFTIPFSEINIIDASGHCGDTLVVVAHAEVFMDGDTTSDHETAFGGDQPGSGPRWWFFAQYSICCDEQPPVNVCETAYAKGGWIWTTDRKSNPENLPSLRLSKNRWGWAIKLLTPGVTTYPIWAGAGLNNTGKGTLVGTLTLDWNGSDVTVTFDVNVDLLAEVHIYAGDGPPQTIAPGQYGYIGEPDGNQFTVTLPLVDSNGDGAWVVAHSVVCTETR